MIAFKSITGGAELNIIVIPALSQVSYNKLANNAACLHYVNTVAHRYVGNRIAKTVIYCLTVY